MSMVVVRFGFSGSANRTEGGAGAEPSPAFSLNPAIDADLLRAEFARSGRLSIPGFVSEDMAAKLRQHLLARQDWALIMNNVPRVLVIRRRDAATMPLEKRRELEAAVHKGAREGFQYRYEMIGTRDTVAERNQSGTLLDHFAMFLSSPTTLDFFRHITGAPDISFADAQATSYGPGDFLTHHDDDTKGLGRRAAYVFGLTPNWRAEWGGLLLFHKENGDIAEGFTPAFNRLMIFAVPATHSVSYVCPFVPHARLSVTGWLRNWEPKPATSP